MGQHASAHGAVYERGAAGADRGARGYVNGHRSLLAVSFHRHHLLLRGRGAQPLPGGPAAALADVGHRTDVLWAGHTGRGIPGRALEPNPAAAVVSVRGHAERRLAGPGHHLPADPQAVRGHLHPAWVWRLAVCQRAAWRRADVLRLLAGHPAAAGRPAGEGGRARVTHTHIRYGRAVAVITAQTGDEDALRSPTRP